MKIVRYLGISLLVGSMLFAPTTASAAPISLNNDSLALNQIVNKLKTNGSEVKVISRDQYLTILAKSKGISLSQADQYDKEQDAKDWNKFTAKFPNLVRNSSTSLEKSSVSPASIGYLSISNTQVYSKNHSFSAVVQATLKIYTSGSFGEIENVTGVGSKKKKGTSDSTWIPMYAWSDPTAGSSEFPTQSITIGASGYYQRVVSASGGISVGVGFVVSGQVGDTVTYVSDTQDLTYTYNLYD